jgi:hypothetical protein
VSRHHRRRRWRSAGWSQSGGVRANANPPGLAFDVVDLINTGAASVAEYIVRGLGLPALALAPRTRRDSQGVSGRPQIRAGTWFRIESGRGQMDPELWQDRRRRPARDDYRSMINRCLPLRERACLSKSAFGSRSEARAVARGGRSSTGQLRPYRCPFEDHWHVGHRSRRSRQRHRPR